MDARALGDGAVNAGTLDAGNQDAGTLDSGTLHGLIAAAASLHPHREAVTFDGGSSSSSPVSLLYKDLLQLSGELSHLLRRSCAPHAGVVGLCCSDDLLVPVWILGILQTPAAYVPLDPDAPGLLSARVITKCRLKHCAVQTDLLQRFQAALVQHVAVEVCAVLPRLKLSVVRVQPPAAAQHEPAAEATGARGAAGADLAYVLHTSGTTGLPKVVRVPHRCILPNILHLRALFQVTARDVVFLASPLTFDPSVVDIFVALSCGAQLLIVPAVVKKTPTRLAQLLFRNHRTTVLQVTPTLLSRFGPHVLKQEVLSPGSSLRVLALGGETCPSPSLLSGWKHEDNKTRVYNIYGITEVSCWASCFEIPPSLLRSSSAPPSSVPLGTPLMDTLVEVRDDRGCVVTEGEGQVFIGGEERVCLLDDEDTIFPGTMRATGDWVKVEDSQLHYLGRRDRMIKRHGKRVNLDTLQQLVGSLPDVESCAVCLHEGWRLLAFVVTSSRGGQAAAPPPPPSEQRREEQPPPSPAERQQQLAWTGAPDPSRRILSQLSPLLPSHSVPDTLVLVPALPLTRHGKVDMQALTEIYQSQRRRLEPHSSWEDVPKLKQRLQTLWQEALGVAANEDFDEKCKFLLCGGDSLRALHLCEDIRAAVGVASPELLEVILDGTFSDLLHHVARVTLMPPLENEARKRQAEAASSAQAKRHRQAPTAAEAPDYSEKRAIKVIRRAGEVAEVNIRDTELDGRSQADVLRETDSSMASSDADVGSGALGLSLSWSSDTGRCVDASPVLVVREGGGEAEATVFIGSHSHRMQALDLDTGRLVWERVLGDRIEASAAVSRCGRLVIVGCYDGCVYFLCAASGETRWTFETGDAVKSCAAVDPLRDQVMVGSHDGHVYALNPKVRRCVWKRHCAGGAVFSSPFLQSDHRRLYVATLAGSLLCLHPDSGEVLWSLSRDVPFFSSPNCSSGHVVIGSVDGSICCFSNTGRLLWRFLTKGPVFSSPCVTPDQRRVVCGSHDGGLYCLNCADGSLVWTFQTAGKVYSSPCVFDGSAAGRRGALVGVASTDGTVYILDARNGQKLISHTLPGELFSSPVVYGSSVVIGCRNDYVYSLKLTVKEEKVQ